MYIILQDTTLRGYDIPRDNTIILANMYSCHMNPIDFPEPEIYRPSRFIDDNGKLVNTEKIIPFGMGSVFYFLKSLFREKMGSKRKYPQT